jgi:glutamine amidotransferase
MKTIGIIDYGMGNIASVQNALRFIGADSVIIDRPELVASVDRLILPGVGAFPMAMDNLRERQLIEPLRQFVLTENKPLIGLCLGMQLLFDASHEFGEHAGLGFIAGNVLPLEPEKIRLPVPHMGWNELTIQRESPILAEIPETERDVYFVHSFYCKADNREDVVATVEYGVEMDVVVQKNNLFGCQFHPEKSQQTGLKILQHFSQL